MMTNLTAVLLKLSGILVLAIGIAHFFMPVFGYDAKLISEVPNLQRNHFIYLGTYMIGSFLVSFAILTLLVNLHQSNAQTRIFLGLMVVVWGLRLMLELIYPAKLALFLMSNAHIGLMMVLPVIWIGYLVAFFQSVRKHKWGV